jgi:tetratricopeptide (TPR) repeat protein
MAEERTLADLRQAVEDALGRDWPQALVLGRELVRRFPGHPSGYQAEAAAARALKLFDHATEIIGRAAERFPSSPWPLIETAHTAQARGDDAEAAFLAARLRREFPDSEAGYQIGVRAGWRLVRNDEILALAVEATRRFPERQWPWIHAALAERARGDHQAALARAEEAIRRFPAAEEPYKIAAAAARQLNQVARAAEVAAEALSRFPDSPWPWIEAARAASADGDDTETARLAEILRQRFPKASEGYQIGIQSARNLARYEEALAIAAEAARLFPAEAWPVTEAGWTLRADGDLGQAERAAADVRARFPDRPDGYRLGVAVLEDADRLDEIPSLLEAASPHFPSADWVGETASRVARLIAMRDGRDRLMQDLAALAPALSRFATSISGARPRVIVVLGMHRAGTSLCAKMLKALGARLGGPLMPAAKSNLEGHFEHLDIVRLHEALLDHEDRRWDSLHLLEPSRPPVSDGQHAEIRAQLKAVVTEQLRASPGVWAFKDPRTARLLPLWTQIFEELDILPVWVLSLRDPRSVAASLNKRNKMPLEIGEFLWCEHYLDILRHLGSRIDVVVHHERWYTSPGPQLAALTDAAGLSAGLARLRIDDVVRPDLGRDEPQDRPFTVALARHLHAALSAEPPDLARLQIEAERIWQHAAGLR